MVMGEDAVPVCVVPAGEVEIVHALEVALDLVFCHEPLRSVNYSVWSGPGLSVRVGVLTPGFYWRRRRTTT
ncbi:MAG: hypothetical protein PVSMB10_04970 [Pseudarthrobacter sp.]